MVCPPPTFFPKADVGQLSRSTKKYQKSLVSTFAETCANPCLNSYPIIIMIKIIPNFGLVDMRAQSKNASLIFYRYIIVSCCYVHLNLFLEN